MLVRLLFKRGPGIKGPTDTIFKPKQQNQTIETSKTEFRPRRIIWPIDIVMAKRVSFGQNMPLLADIDCFGPHGND